jgi:ankyrin repeat protein
MIDEIEDDEPMPPHMVEELYKEFYRAVGYSLDVKCIEILQKGPLFLNVPEARNWFLIKACKNGKMGAARFLIEKGADVNTTDDGLDVLSSTAAAGQIDAVRLLLEHGADPNRTRCLITTVNGSGVGEHREAILKLLLEKGANPNLVFAMFGDKSNARTVLDFASNDSPLRKMLLEHGAKTAKEILKENPNVEIR